MKSKNATHYIVLALLLALLTFFFSRSQLVDPHAHAEISDALNMLEQSEVALGQNVLKNRSDLLRHYVFSKTRKTPILELIPGLWTKF